MKIRATVWGENIHEHKYKEVNKIYPEGMHTAIAKGLDEEDVFSIRTATLQEVDHGLSEKMLDQTDVLLWWGHCAHEEVCDEIAERVQCRVLEGMGLIVLHSGHYSKVFKRLLGTSCSLTWRVAAEKERLWVCNPGHPIVQGLGSYFELPHTEMYGEPFGVPPPEEQIFISWFEGGEVFRSGLCYRRGNGKIFYFRPGHETYPIYYDNNVKLVLKNAVKWAAPQGSKWLDRAPNIPVDQAPESISNSGLE